MELTQLNIPANKIEQLKRAGLERVEDLLHNYPRKYIDRSALTGIQPTGESLFLFRCESVHLHNRNMMPIEAKGFLAGTNAPVHILWFNQSFMYSDISATKGKTVLVAGTVKYIQADIYGNPARYEVGAPTIYDPAGADALRIYPVYKKVKGMADDYYLKQLQTAKSLLGELDDILPPDIVTAHSLMTHNDMVSALHAPKDMADLEQALTRKRWDDLLYFALRIEMNNRKVSKGSIYSLPSLTAMNAVRNSLPFHLTGGQEAALNGAIEHIRKGQRLNALIQGDVGCGKTVVAQLLMIAFATNGYQTAMMAPTQLLAQQHYEGMKSLCEPLGIEVYLIDGKAAPKKATLNAISDGTAKVIIGTQALISDKYQFNNLALVVEDEEHKYGVMQREALMQKAAGGTHTITMSATPIPRSLAQTIYGDALQLFSINEKPPGRKPVLTGIAPDELKAIAFLKRICRMGQQAYVVCPMIAANEKMEGVMAAEKVFEIYRTALEPYGICVGLVTGKTDKKVAGEILAAFENGEISVLVSTTVIEVGINVPNASCMIIHNAERFGLAQLHQLRGRVGRGSSDAFCSLISSDSTNPRLLAMVQTNDGFEIAKVDLQQRGAGDFLGVQQSGTEKYLAMALQYPEEYRKAQAAAQDLLDRTESCALVKTAIQDQAEARCGELL